MALATPPANEPDGIITSDQIGDTTGGPYGSEIGPAGFQQDMWQIDPIAGVFPPQERNASQASFTGGMGGTGLGGMAEPMAPGGDSQPGQLPNTVLERIGF